MDMVYIVRALVFLLETVLAAAGMTMSLNDAQTPPSGGTGVGSTDVVQAGVAVLTLTRGTGPSLQTYWTGYWTASGG
jgi:hypothetical protein